MLRGPRGGGPCPLVVSSMGRGFRVLAFGHFFLVALTIALVSSAAAFDLHCAPLISTLPHAVISGISSIVITVFYLVTSFKSLGTEVEWMVRTTTSISLAVIDIAFSCWGFFLLESAAFKIFKAFKNELQIEPECLQTISIIFLVSSFVILFAHIIISGYILAVISVIFTFSPFKYVHQGPKLTELPDLEGISTLGFVGLFSILNLFKTL